MGTRFSTCIFFDFNLKTYQFLFNTLKEKGYSFVRFDDFLKENSKIKNQKSKIVILRHDVDRKPGNSLATAKIESELGIKGTYYFRIVPESFDEKIIKEIASLGHEVGYHYEELESPLLVSPKGREKGLQEIIESAYEAFKANLEKMRSVAEVKTICMHGSPLSKYDNKEIWSHRDANGNQYDYKELGIIGEPYFDIDWNEFGYLTDTGRRWNGNNVSVRDKVDSKYIFNFKKTRDIIDNINSLPDKIMITIHPQRWTNSWSAWVHELVWQNLKNAVKKIIVNGR